MIERAQGLSEFYPAPKCASPEAGFRVVAYGAKSGGKKSEAVPSPKIGLFSDLDLRVLQIIWGVRFWLVGSNSNCAGGEADF